MNYKIKLKIKDEVIIGVYNAVIEFYEVFQDDNGKLVEKKLCDVCATVSGFLKPNEVYSGTITKEG